MFKINIAVPLLMILFACVPQETKGPDKKIMSSLGSKFKNEWLREAKIFEDRIQKDSSDVEAYLGFAESHVINYIFGYVSRADAIPKAKDAFDRVLSLDSTHAGVLKLSGILKFLDWDWTGAEQSFKSSITTSPEDLSARHWYSLYLAAMSRMDEAKAQHDTIQTMDVNEDYLIGRGSMLYFAREFKQMKELMIKAVNKDTTVAWGYDWLGMAYIELKQYDESLATYYKAFELSDGTVEVGAGLGHALGQAGRRETAKQMADFYAMAAEDKYLPYCQRAFIHISIQEYEESLKLLEKAYEEKSWFLIFMNIEPWYEPLRGKQRFQTLVEKMNYPIEKPK
ncbi:MAG: hypothetical protein ABJF04_04575 [Reichenbachiella sp.]|uniref:tetratricopeptide repeat protein n=1 Tax=Reichenbachiella sp. TaxID=2184521 RepID=UPI003267178C